MNSLGDDLASSNLHVYVFRSGSVSECCTGCVMRNEKIKCKRKRKTHTSYIKLYFFYIYAHRIYALSNVLPKISFGGSQIDTLKKNPTNLF